MKNCAPRQTRVGFRGKRSRLISKTDCHHYRLPQSTTGFVVFDGKFSSRNSISILGRLAMRIHLMSIWNGRDLSRKDKERTAMMEIRTVLYANNCQLSVCPEYETCLCLRIPL